MSMWWQESCAARLNFSTIGALDIFCFDVMILYYVARLTDCSSRGDNSAIIGEIKVVEKYQKWFVYIIRCEKDDTLYTGITINLKKRIKQHNEGKGARYTRGRGPVTIVKCFERLTKSDALKLEYKIKQLSKEEKLNYAEKEN
jgi:putative endonuclease